jgi:hypothetical protein
MPIWSHPMLSSSSSAFNVNDFLSMGISTAAPRSSCEPVRWITCCAISASVEALEDYVKRQKKRLGGVPRHIVTGEKPPKSFLTSGDDEEAAN